MSSNNCDSPRRRKMERKRREGKWSPSQIKISFPPSCWLQLGLTHSPPWNCQQANAWHNGQVITDDMWAVFFPDWLSCLSARKINEKLYPNKHDRKNNNTCMGLILEMCCSSSCRLERAATTLVLHRLSKGGKDWRQDERVALSKVQHISLSQSSMPHQEQGEDSNTEVTRHGSNRGRHSTAWIWFTGKQKNGIIQSSPLLLTWVVSLILLKANKLVSDLSGKWVPPNDDFYKSLSAVKLFTLRWEDQILELHPMLQNWP